MEPKKYTRLTGGTWVSEATLKWAWMTPAPGISKYLGIRPKPPEDKKDDPPQEKPETPPEDNA